VDVRAPKQSEAPFVVAQPVLMALFVVLGIFAVKRFVAETGPWCCGLWLAVNSVSTDRSLKILVSRNALLGTLLADHRRLGRIVNRPLLILSRNR
jgi:hypothetical protein